MADQHQYLYDHPAGDKEVGEEKRRSEEGSHHEMKNNAEIKSIRKAYQKN